jgi:ketosteroid isomerase-like protein
VPGSSENTTRDEVLAAFQEHLRAMTAGDTDALDSLLDRDFTLTHMTGYVQPKHEWLTEMDERLFVYHRIQERSTTVDVEGDTAHVVGRTVTDATVYGMRANWHLQLTVDYVRTDDGWTAVRSVATTW